ncbi:MAG: hypothetical protein QOF40_1045 [Actinomycetota bacterium]|nr:hypothetical protein [Actinomycetota bacterium]
MCPVHPADERTVVDVDLGVLREVGLPDSEQDTSKFDRGQVLIVGGAAETPGGVMLAGLAALRVGAGRVHVATAASIAGALAVAMPEARVTALPETDLGALADDGAALLAEPLEQADVLTIGSGCLDPEATGAFLAHLVPIIPASTTVVVDAAALPIFATSPRLLETFGERAVLLPNIGEMARMLERSIDQIATDPVRSIVDAVDRFGGTIALRDACTYAASPSRGPFVHRFGSPALATSGSGDVLAGAVAGLAAQGASPMAAALWAIRAHGQSGARLAARDGGPGLLARELLDVIATELNALRAATR